MLSQDGVAGSKGRKGGGVRKLGGDKACVSIVHSYNYMSSINDSATCKGKRSCCMC